MKKQLSIKFKITLFYTLSTIFIVATMLLFMVHISGRVVDADVKDKLVLLVEEDVDNIDFDIIDEDDIGEVHEDGNIVFRLDDGQIGSLSVDDAYISAKNGVEMFIFSSSGEILIGQDPDYDFTDIDLVPGKITHVTFNDTSYYAYTRALSLTDKNITVNFTLVGVTQDTGTAFHGTTGSIVKAAFIILPLAILLAGILGYVITRGLFKPFGAIVSTAQTISRGDDLSKRVDIGPGTDELHMLADTYNTMLERLQTSFESEKAFTSDSSHELRTPTAIISAQCEYALSEPRSNEDYVECLEVIDRQSKRMTLVISQLLSFTRLEQGTQKLNFESINLGSFVDEICCDMEAAGSKDITLTCEKAEGIFVKADITLFSRLIINLISNAYKYGRTGGFIKVNIQREITDGNAASRYALIQVTDNGIGIAESEINKIFRRFYKGDKSRVQDADGETSTGLGLAFVQKIAEVHGGSVSVISKLGEGSTFTVRLPIE